MRPRRWRGTARLAPFFALLVSAGLPAQDLRRPPAGPERAYAAKIGWEEATGKLGAALRSAYQPGRGGVAGSSGNAAFQSWLLLYRWCELLSRKESDELLRFFSGFFAIPSGSSDNRPTFFPPGHALPPGATPLPPEQVRRIIADRETRQEVGSRLLPRDYVPQSETIAAGLDPAFLSAMAADDAFLEAFFANLSEQDFVPAALKALQQIWTADPAAFRTYRNLAIALALVRDQRAPIWWPHQQVKATDVPTGVLPVVDEFQFWVESNENKALYTDLKKLSPEELKFVVDAPISPEELRWAQKNARFPRADFGRAFSSIRYRHDRVEDQVFVWNEGPYTLETIQKNGGICVDQAYFAMLCGKARGLPTLYFTGQGTDGGHAWFGYLKGENRWDMNCGRYENQNYAVGHALDPQTWRPINDHELASLAESFRRTPGYQASQRDLVMAEIFARAGENSRALAALDSAIATSPRNDQAWAAKENFLVRSEATPAVQTAFHQAALRQFANNEDLKVSHQRALASLARQSGDEKTAGALEAQIISQNRRGRSDLSVNAAATRLEGLVEAGKLDDAMKEYRNVLSRLGRTSGGNFFYEIVQPFAEALAERGDRGSARRVVDLARSSLRPEAGSILDQDLDALTQRLQPSPAAGR